MSRRIHNWQVPFLIAAGLLLTANFASPQEAQKASTGSKEASTRPASVYRLDFVVRELENGKALNSRSYSLSERSGELGNLRVGTSVPIGSMESGDYKGVQYQDVGISIDCRPEERNGGDVVLLNTGFESSSVVAPEEATQKYGPSGPVPPIFRRVRFRGNSLVALGKPTVISTLDDVTSNRRYEVEVTVTKVK
jgi:hypothetical protein